MTGFVAFYYNCCEIASLVVRRLIYIQAIAAIAEGRRLNRRGRRGRRGKREEGEKKVKLDEERYDGKLNSCNVLNEN